MVETVK